MCTCHSSLNWPALLPAGCCSLSRSHRWRHAASDIDRRRLEGAVRLLGGPHDDDLRTRLDLALLARRIGDDRRLGRDDDLFLSILVFDHDLLAIHAGHRGINGGIRHRAARTQVPGTMTLASAAHAFEEDVDGD